MERIKIIWRTRYDYTIRGRILGGVKHVGRNSDRFGKGERGR